MSSFGLDYKRLCIAENAEDSWGISNSLTRLHRMPLEVATDDVLASKIIFEKTTRQRSDTLKF